MAADIFPPAAPPSSRNSHRTNGSRQGPDYASQTVGKPNNPDSGAKGDWINLKIEAES